MFEINGKTFRNLEEQVQKNKEDIANHYAIDRALANFGIKIVGTVADPADLPNPLTYNGEFGDGYAVGVPGDYTYYIYTRPDPNAGRFDNYWLDVGKISIVGPQGPQGLTGAQGEKGDRGSLWFTQDTTNIIPQNGDLKLERDGEVRQYISGGFVPYTNIRGPQGVQGVQGSIGPQGPQGEIGPKGDTGDTGGLVNINGILANADQLPTPESLNNTTVAYLVGTTQPYDLYIQVGTEPSTALWNNIGPMNAATLVTVNGLGQNVWDADTKLDKFVVEGNAGDKVYVAKYNGTQGTTFIGARPGYITRYTGTADNNTDPGTSCTIPVSMPQSDYSATPKKYVDDNFLAKPNAPSNILIGYSNSTGMQSIYYTNAIPYAGRVCTCANASDGVNEPAGDGYYIQKDPVQPYHLATKNYVDSKGGYLHIVNCMSVYWEGGTTLYIKNDSSTPYTLGTQILTLPTQDIPASGTITQNDNTYVVCALSVTGEFTGAQLRVIDDTTGSISAVSLPDPDGVSQIIDMVIKL